MSRITLLVGFLLGVVLSAQVIRNGDVALQNWAAPLYWQPSATETEARRMDSLQRTPTPEATTPVGALVFVAITPCRVVDTRVASGFPGAFGPPSLAGGLPVRTIPIQSSSACPIPSIAQAYSFNVTVVPQGTLGFLTLYPATAGSQPPPPNVSTLNSLQGTVVANAAIVPAGTDGHGGVDVYASNPTDLIIDINGYYVPSTGITLAQGTASAPSLSFSGDPGTGIFSSGLGTLNLATGGMNRLTISSDGDLDLTGNIRKGGTLFLHNAGVRSLGAGLGALASNNGDSNTAAGYYALSGNSSGGSNTAIGAGALNYNTSGGLNTATGAFALYNNTTGDVNTAFGDTALFSNTTGGYNTAIGPAVLTFNTTGTGNTGIGNSALYNNTTGINNTACGSVALQNNTAGTNNIGIGYIAGINITTGSNNIDIGNQGLVNDSGVIRIGDSANQTSFFAAGIRGVTTGQPNAVSVVIDSTGQLGTINSSRRFKEDIEDMGDASSALFELRPVTFRYQNPYADGSKPIDYGLIAEEVAEVYPDLVVKGPDGQIETVQYHKLTPMLLNELQKQKAQIAALQDEHETIESLHAQIAALRKTLEIFTGEKMQTVRKEAEQR